MVLATAKHPPIDIDQVSLGAMVNGIEVKAVHIQNFLNIGFSTKNPIRQIANCYSGTLMIVVVLFFSYFSCLDNFKFKVTHILHGDLVVFAVSFYMRDG